jgi:O-antigen ligase
MPRGLLIFALCLPLAVLLGFMLADPLMGRNMMVITGALFMLLIPLALTIHHRALIWFSSAFVSAFFLPGQPQFWMIFSVLSFLISVLSWPLARAKLKPVWDPGVLASLLFLAVVMVVTAVHSGGIGLKVLGSATFGGRKYLYMICAIVGFVALTMQVIPRKNALKDLSAFCLAPASAAVGSLAYMLGSNFYFLFLLFPAEMAMNQAMADFDPGQGGLKRYTGFGPAAIAIVMCALMRWGLRGILDLKRPGRLLLVMCALFLGLLSGFRSALGVCFIIGGVQFFAEGLYRTRYAVVLGTLAVAAYGFVAVFAESLPLSAQRAISFLPIKVDTQARLSAQSSIDWRLNMWSVAAKDIPKYFWIGKGYAVDPTDLYFATESVRRGFAQDFDLFLRAGDYHSGPLSVILPFGIFGVIGFLWFCAASISVLWKNMRYGDVSYKQINIFLFSMFIGRLIFFLFFFGSIEVDLWVLVSIVGISLSLNGGAAVKPQGARLRFERGRHDHDRDLVPI